MGLSKQPASRQITWGVHSHVPGLTLHSDRTGLFEQAFWLCIHACGHGDAMLLG